MNNDDMAQLSMEEAEMALAAYLAPWVEGARVSWDLPGGGEGLAYLTRAARAVDRGGAPGPTDWWVSRAPSAGEDVADLFERLAATRNVALLAQASDAAALRDTCAGKFAHMRVLGLTAWRAAGLVEMGAAPSGVAFDDSLAGPREPTAVVLLGGEDLSRLDPYTVVALPLSAPRSGQRPSGGARVDPAEADFQRLEARLRRVASARREVERERERIAGLLRDLSQIPFSSAPTAVSSTADAGDYAERAAAAIASREEARYRASEFSTALEQARAELQANAKLRAQLEGCSRGLTARLAEVEEMRLLAEAQLTLAREDVVSAASQELRLERSLAEANEAVEMAVVREHGAPPASGASGSAVERELSALRARAESLKSERDHARAESLRLLALVGTLENAAEGMRGGHRRRVAELLADAQEQERRLRAAHERALSSLRGELAGLRARMADDRATTTAVTSVQASQDDSQQRLTDALDQADALRVDIAELRAERLELTLRSADLSVSSEQSSARALELASSIAARDALVERLQLDLVEEEQVSRRREESRQRADAECARLRDALLLTVEAPPPGSCPPERVDEYEQTQIELEQQLAELRHGVGSERAVAQQERALADEARARCAALEGDLGAQRQRVAELTSNVERSRQGAEASREALREARELLAALGQEASPGSEGRASSEITAVGASAPGAADETLMRSLTAQLEERNERLRVLEGRLATADRTGERLALEETVAKLRSDLASERSARQAAESKAGDEGTRAELDTLRQTLRDRYADMLRARSEVEGAEAQASALRGALAETRGGLEGLLGDATASGDTTTADRAGALLRLLGRF